ncbi:hypothetical protein PMIN06_011889 [Paraphaeosphaeria minitans]
MSTPPPPPPPPPPPTFPCPTCGAEHALRDALPVGDSAHKPHCPFCLAHTLYRAVIPEGSPAARPPPEQVEMNNVVRIRKMVLGVLALGVGLAGLAFRWQMGFWADVAGGWKGSGEGMGQDRRRWEDRALYAMLCTVGLAPCGFVLGFGGAGAYYVVFCVRKRRARKAAQGPGELAGLRGEDAQGLNELIRVVVTPPESLPPREPPVRASRMGRVLSVFSGGYDGRGVRRESFRLEEMGGSGRKGRPETEWPVL